MCLPYRFACTRYVSPSITTEPSSAITAIGRVSPNDMAAPLKSLEQQFLECQGIDLAKVCQTLRHRRNGVDLRQNAAGLVLLAAVTSLLGLRPEQPSQQQSGRKRERGRKDHHLRGLHAALPYGRLRRLFLLRSVR